MIYNTREEAEKVRQQLISEYKPSDIGYKVVIHPINNKSYRLLNLESPVFYDNHTVSIRKECIGWRGYRYNVDSCIHSAKNQAIYHFDICEGLVCVNDLLIPLSSIDFIELVKVYKSTNF